MPQGIGLPFAEGCFEGWNIAVTGARRGIGAAVARAFLALGANVFAHAGVTELKSGDPLADGLGADERGRLKVFTANLEDESETAQLAAEISAATPRIDVLVHNAGTMHGRVMTSDMTPAHYHRVSDLNAASTVAMMHGLLPALARGGDNKPGASVIFTSSISARTGGSPGSSVYSAAKAFVSAYARSLARELAPEGIRVNAISPGTIMTDFHRRYSTEEKLAATAKAIPLGRLGTPEDCVGAYLFLARADLSGYVTGQTIEVNGGQFMG